ncbi:2'-5' RNA ligase [Waterburya agarophytonicola K14]|uniref:2'-5' RNA ligase n=1 Tax=Waterburya agarophytonicola KI4 TaxID=2874699 RepID=A0A964BR71_9CYAN|nr:T4 RnlA family RNA ligase [Waterburya agarophytonicola]MCC0176315.1 2'-5' RNA ligase [Waterburya agarophytonicola KI4]
MELQDYLRNRGLDKLTEEYNIKVNRHSKIDNLVCLKYSQLESPMGEKIVQQCRGIIFDETNNWNIVSYPYDKFFNYGESYAPKLNWDAARIYEKLDGSLMTLFYYEGEWRVQSSGMADAGGDVSGFKYTFQSLFWKVWQELDYQLPTETEYCFMFELMTPYNRIVVRHDRHKLVLHGVRNKVTLKEEDPQIWTDKYNWQLVATYPLQTLEEIVAMTDKLDPMDSEGYIICDREFKRIKVKSPQYVAISHLKTGFSSRRMLEIVVTNEGEEFLNYYPEWQELYQQIATQYNALIEEIEEQYYKYQNIPVQKDFAIAVKNLSYSGILFALRAGKSNSVKESLAQTSIYKLENLLNINFQELG